MCAGNLLGIALAHGAMPARWTAGRAETRERESAGDRWRDKLELRLDNRQVFFLFFGSAVVACMLFILGVLVGKRIETRGQAEAAMPQIPWPPSIGRTSPLRERWRPPPSRR